MFSNNSFYNIGTRFQRELDDLKSRPDAAKAHKEIEAKANQVFSQKRDVLQYILQVLQGVHVSLIWEHHDVIAGVAGIITSSMEVQENCNQKSSRRIRCAFLFLSGFYSIVSMMFDKI